MDMDSGMSGGPDLTAAGLNMLNYTVASDFLAAVLDDSVLQQSDYAFARAFWYGIVIVIVLAGIVGLSTLRLSGVYFVIFSFGLAELVRQLVTWYEVNKTRTLGR